MKLHHCPLLRPFRSQHRFVAHAATSHIHSNAFSLTSVLFVHTCVAGAASAGTLAANGTGIVLTIYLCVVVNSYRLQLRQEAGLGGAVRLPSDGQEGGGGTIPTFDDGMGGVPSPTGGQYKDSMPELSDDDDDELRVTAKDVRLGGARAPAVKPSSAAACKLGRLRDLSLRSACLSRWVCCLHVVSEHFIPFNEHACYHAFVNVGICVCSQDPHFTGRFGR